jgi:hypothetical protein
MNYSQNPRLVAIGRFRISALCAGKELNHRAHSAAEHQFAISGFAICPQRNPVKQIRRLHRLPVEGI